MLSYPIRGSVKAIVARVEISNTQYVNKICMDDDKDDFRRLFSSVASRSPSGVLFNSESRCSLSFVLSKYLTLFKRYNDLFQLSI